MKTKLLITIICACPLFKLQAQEWGYVSSLQNEWLRKIWTQGLDTVYIVGEKGLIARSIDASEHWNKQYFQTKVALNDIIFIDHYTGFAVGEQGTILKTVDAGENWSQIPVTTSSQINAIAATGLDNIWAVGDNSLILHSIDEGETWEQVNILPENNRQLLDIAFRGNLGYFTGNFGFTLYKTEDAGITWNKQTAIEQLNPYYFFMEMHSINIMENKTYMTFGNELYVTEDQINWESVNNNMFCGNPFFLNDNVGYDIIVATPVGVGHETLYIIKTNNGGKDWEIAAQNIAYNLSQVAGDRFSMIKVINNTLGYAIAEQVLVKIPAPPPVGINKTQGNTQLHISQITRDELVLKSEANPIQSIEFFDILGNKLIYKQWQNPVQETNININNLNKGVYLIKIVHEDSIVSINKYLIR